ncbi:helix-turn-helix domain-containing protein [Nocardia sp. IFM 10818]
MADTGSADSIDSPNSTRLRRRIGRAFEHLRTSHDPPITLDQAAKKLDRARATLSRIESGHESVRFRESDVKAMLELYGATDQEAAELLALTAETRKAEPAWWQSYPESDLPERFRLFVALESGAELILKYESELIPGLLQTRDYARAVLATPKGSIPAEVAEGQLSVRMDRQSVLTQPRAPRLEVLLNEAVIRRPVGGADVMANQIERLLSVTQQHNVQIRIVPFSAGIHGGMVTGAFSLMTFPDSESALASEPPLVYTDTLAGALYLDKTDEVEEYRRVWRDMDQRALDENATRDLLQEALKGFRK